jgi:hypothetical protein
MTEPQLEERPSPEVEKHPPFRMRTRSRVLLPDLTPPTLTELRWAAHQRRVRRSAPPLSPPPPPPLVAEVIPPEPEVSFDEVYVEDTASDHEEIDQVELDDPAPDEVMPVDLSPRGPEVVEQAVVELVVEPAPQWPAVLEPDETPSFARLRSRAPAPRDPWLDRGPLIDDPDGEEVLDVEPSLDLDFHPATAVLPSPAASRSDDEVEAPLDEVTEVAAESVFFDVRADAKPLVADPIQAPEPEPEPVLVEVEPTDEPDPDLAAVDLAPWRPPAATEDLEDGPPLVSHLLVVREPRGSGPPRIAVLDDSATMPELEAISSVLAPTPEPLPPDIEERFEPAPAVPKVWDGRPAPLYWRVLRLRHIRPNGWLRAMFFEGSVAVAVVLVLAEAASVWTIVVLPIVVALIVKANDVLVGNLRRSFERPQAVSLRDQETVARSRDEYEMSGR